MSDVAVDTSGCTGACCAAFHLEYTLTELRTRKLQDGAFIADMVIPLSPKEARQRAEQFGGTGKWPWKLRGHYFACRHWDEKTRLCTVYDRRPRMCSGYPYEGEPCGLGKSCTYVGGCQGRKTSAEQPATRALRQSSTPAS
jgi:Fe-S-cluster containining protein